MRQSELEQFKRDGVLLIKNAIFPWTLYRIKNDIGEVFSAQVKRHGINNRNKRKLFELYNKDPDAIIGCGKAIQNLPSIYSFMVSEQIMKHVKQLIEFPVISTKPVVFFHSRYLAKEEVYWKTGSHQDWSSIMGSLNNIVIWVPLVSCMNKDIGPLEVIKGSHLQGSRLNHYENNFGIVSDCKDEDFEPIYCDVGDMVIMSAMTVHRSGTNISEKIRYSINFRYNDLMDEYWQNNNFYSPYIYKSQPDRELRPTAEDMERIYE